MLQNAKATRREWIGLAVLALPCALYSMDLTVLNLAVPALSADLKPSSTQLLWIVDIYGFLLAGLLITMGSLGDRIGRRRLLMIGAVAFGLASILAAFSTSAAMLIAMRAILGVAGATLAPSTLSLIRNMFHDPGERTFAIGVWITSFSAGAAIGPPLGGLLLQHFWWGSVFLVAVPAMVLILILGPILLPEFRDSDAGKPDLLSAALSLAAVLLVIHGLKGIAAHGLALGTAASVAGGLLAAAAFLRRQVDLADPLLDIRLFRVPAFSASLAIYLLATFVAFGSFFFIAQYLQLVLDMEPLKAGLWTMPFALAFIVGSLTTPAIVKRIRPAHVMAAGLCIAAIGFGVLTRVGGTEGPAVLVTGFVVFSLGLAPAFTLTTDLVVGTAPPERAGAAAAMSETSSELGGALGIAVLGSVGAAVYQSAMAAVAPTGIPAEAAEAVRGTLGGAVAVAETLAPQVAGAMLASAREAFTRSLELTSGICLVVAVAAAALSMIFLRDVGVAPAQPPKDARDPAAVLG